MEILAALLNAQFGPAQVDAEQGAVLLQVSFCPLSGKDLVRTGRKNSGCRVAHVDSNLAMKPYKFLC